MLKNVSQYYNNDKFDVGNIFLVFTGYGNLLMLLSKIYIGLINHLLLLNLLIYSHTLNLSVFIKVCAVVASRLST